MEFQTVLVATLPVFLIVVIGWVTHKVGIIGESTERSMMRLVLNVLLPCLILTKVSANESLTDTGLVFAALGIGFVSIAVGLAICYLTGRSIGIKSTEGLNTFCVATAIQNYAYLAIPLIEGLFPDNADSILGVLFVHNLGVEIALWTLGVVLISGSAAGAWRRLINGPSIAIVFGLALNFTGVGEQIPAIINTAVDRLGQCSIPISLILVGAALGGVLEQEKWRPDWRVMIVSPSLRFVVLPAMLLLTAKQVTFSNELQHVLVVQAAMPAAVFPIVLAKHFGGHPGVAVQCAVVTWVLSILVTPALLLLGLTLLGSN